MRYIRCALQIDPPQPGTEIFIAALSELGFESFEETPGGVNAYIPESQWSEADFLQIPFLNSGNWEVSYQITPVEPRNWNAVWESDYASIQVRDRCVVRAPFHPEPPAQIAFDILISPKMSFGTGHHQTTFLMLDYLLDLDLDGKTVLDVGTGTGVLAILSAMKGAGGVTAVDIDAWAYENCRENTRLNGQGEIEVIRGSIGAVEGRHFDLVLANINKNILLEQLPDYARVLEKGGALVLSGFYRKDLPDLQTAALNKGLTYVDSREKDTWTAACFRKENH